jgi:predicted site-specific integrase-resolvase
MPHYRKSEVAEPFGVSDDTVRRRADSGQLTAIRDSGGRKAVDGVELAAFAKSQAHATLPWWTERLVTSSSAWWPR